MKLTIHRGAKEIGGSCVEIIGKKSRLVVDIGIPLVDHFGVHFDLNDYKHLSGPELQDEGILPNIAGFYNWDSTDKPVDGLLISHAHLDHYGFYDHVSKNICFYLGRATKELIDLTTRFTAREGSIGKFRSFESEKPFKCGEFTITPYLMDHSAFDAYAFLIDDGEHKIIYSGDFRDHGRKWKLFYRFLHRAPKEVDALLLEGTMLGREDEKKMTEDDLEQHARKIMRDAKNIVLLYLSSQNIDRVVSFYKALLPLDKIFIVDIYTAHVLKTVGRINKIPHPSPEYENIRVFYPRWLSERIASIDKKLLYEFNNYKINRDEISDIRHRAVMMVRPSMLYDLEKMENIDGAVFIYSLWRGYMENPNYQKMKDFIDQKNIKLQYLHTSGHGYISTLKKAINRLNPKGVIPIHTFHPDNYEQLGGIIHQLSDGEILDLSDLNSVPVGLKNDVEVESQDIDIKADYLCFREQVINKFGESYAKSIEIFFERAIFEADRGSLHSAIKDAEFALALSNYEFNNLSTVFLVGFLCQVHLDVGNLKSARSYLNLGYKLLEKDDDDYNELKDDFDKLKELLDGEQWKE